MRSKFHVTKYSRITQLLDSDAILTSRIKTLLLVKEPTIASDDINQPRVGIISIGIGFKN